MVDLSVSSDFLTCLNQQLKKIGRKKKYEQNRGPTYVRRVSSGS